LEPGRQTHDLPPLRRTARRNDRPIEVNRHGTQFLRPHK
jgi:hypothetical protein